MPIKSKRLLKKAESALEKLWTVKLCNGLDDLQFMSQHDEIKRMLWRSIDNLRSFIDNIDNGKNF